MSVNLAAAGEAERWRAGLAEWGQARDRIARLRAAADVRVYTPGSRAGTPLALLELAGWRRRRDSEDVAGADHQQREQPPGARRHRRIAAAHSRAHTLICRHPARASTGQDADLPWLVQQIQRPAFDRIGVLDLETFYPGPRRQDLALALQQRAGIAGVRRLARTASLWMSAGCSTRRQDGRVSR